MCCYSWDCLFDAVLKLQRARIREGEDEKPRWRGAGRVAVVALERENRVREILRWNPELLGFKWNIVFWRLLTTKLNWRKVTTREHLNARLNPHLNPVATRYQISMRSVKSSSTLNQTPNDLTFPVSTVHLVVAFIYEFKLFEPKIKFLPLSMIINLRAIREHF